ncbi:hypothetical protein ADL12_06195 [Streptomyces regalis]|uniref:Bacterioferritin n=2 Tax=Streptomyces regalis TaxID=68262 RepID=A0A0X3VHP0_9ACTN|nr:hypothetical protein [Streptomyces regalis]KUL44124.1 hypothetical protein ADL12_06195 [Streptomyces regalis]
MQHAIRAAERVSQLGGDPIVISTYQDIIRWLGNSDPTIRWLMDSILEEEEEHADDIIYLLGS